MPRLNSPLNRPECHALLPRLVALDNATPAVTLGRRQLRELGASAGNVLADGNIRKEAADAVAAALNRRMAVLLRVLRGEPVVVEVVLLADSVANELDGLLVVRRQVEALEASGALGDAARDGVDADGCRGRGSVGGDDVALGTGDVGASECAVAGRCERAVPRRTYSSKTYVILWRCCRSKGVTKLVM